MFLEIYRNRDVRDTSECQSRAAGQVRNIFDMTGSHDSRVVNSDIHEYFVELDILLCICVDKIVILQSGNCQNRLSIEFRVVKSVQQVESPRTRSCKADTKPPR